MEHNQQASQGRRGHFHRGRRGSDRRGQDRREPPAAQPEQGPRGGDHVDVEQIMRDIRARIAQRHGIELSNQQVQELAARRLEAILDPRTVSPALLEQLRKSAGAPATDPLTQQPPEPAYTFEEDTLFESHRGLLRMIRALLKPILKLFFNPNPLIRALNIQARINTEAAARDLERERRQTEWNALHYELLQRMVTETARLSIEMQSLSLKVDALAGKVDFNERRVRGIEGAQHQPHPQSQSHSRPQPRVADGAPPPAPPAADAVSGAAVATAPLASTGTAAPGAPDGTRRRRRRRRGRRGTGPADDTGTAVPTMGGQPPAAGVEVEFDSGDEDGDDDAPETLPGEPSTPEALPTPPLATGSGQAAEPPAEHAAPAPALAPAPAPVADDRPAAKSSSTPEALESTRDEG